ncbi:protein of unknown function [Georgfuchsia toluolica]|uniref:Uncharacterized protein n=1 Tax=Georgfuchsia toluolica TaxID=424218 RepID=A0A916N884_9PROT|nr:protein of unknown function [Georgfuchsia toluolica]
MPPSSLILWDYLLNVKRSLQSLKNKYISACNGHLQRYPGGTGNRLSISLFNMQSYNMRLCINIMKIETIFATLSEHAVKSASILQAIGDESTRGETDTHGKKRQKSKDPNRQCAADQP